jgi:hypothetical protein
LSGRRNNMKTINLSKVNGKKAIGSSDLVYCNIKYHTPYLAVISPAGEMLWQEKLHSGYGKHRETYYNVENLKPGDYIQAAGGSGGNKYPFKGKVVELTDTTLIVEEIQDTEFSNIIAERKRSVSNTAEFSTLDKIIPGLREKIDKNQITSSEFAFLTIYNFGMSVRAYQSELGRQILTELQDRIDDIKTPSPRIIFERGN